MDLTPTPSQTVGPYLHLGLTDLRSVACVAGGTAGDERMRLTYRVLDGEGVPVPDAMVEVWQADAEGRYNIGEQDARTNSAPGFCGYGRLATGDDGSCTFETVKPGRVPYVDGTLQAPHVNVSILGRGILKRLSTRTYFDGDMANAEDPVLALLPDDRRSTLLARPDADRPGSWIAEIRLRGEGETVFFDV
jgi:protocatechuate 3,4-dioxygenase, alpha subunit